jgi:hypothetical protein
MGRFSTINGMTPAAHRMTPAAHPCRSPETGSGLRELKDKICEANSLANDSQVSSDHAVRFASTGPGRVRSGFPPTPPTLMSDAFKKDISFNPFLGRGSGESIPMEFKGEGFVVVQPFEEVYMQAGG